MLFGYMMLITYILIINLTFGYKNQNEKIVVSGCDQRHVGWM
ncbi:hypothetical protein PPBDW_II0252 [Photobacterium kishitanii]|nr:hypothetical protein PPBDW_II0252 [Photobacterium kishitanii]